jgi:hypothetical protein
MTMDKHDAVHVIDLALRHAKNVFEAHNINVLIAEVDKVIKVQPMMGADDKIVTPAEFMPQFQQLLTVWETVLNEADPRNTHYMCFCTGTQQAVRICLGLSTSFAVF